MRYFYDTEFLEDGLTIELISIGIVCEDGREYYAVRKEAPWTRIATHQWLVDNVVPSLPQIPGDWVSTRSNPLGLDFQHPDIQSLQTIAGDLISFFSYGDVELWADYSAYDHVALCQVFGTMLDLPATVPMWTHDLEQLWETAGRPPRPPQAEGQHNALEDARWNARFYLHCTD